MCFLNNWFVWLRAWLCKYWYWPVCQKVVGNLFIYIFFLLDWTKWQPQIKACLEWSLEKSLSLLLWIQNAISSCFHIWTYSVLLPFITVNCITFNDDVSGKKISLTLCHLQKQLNMWKHFSVELGHAVSPAVLTQVKSY